MTLMNNINKRPWIISLFLVLALSAWIASGSMDAREPEAAADAAAVEAAALKVRVRTVNAEQIDRSVTLYGRTEPNRTSGLRAETSGRIAEIFAPRGTAVKADDPILRIAMNDRKEQLAHAKAQLAQRELEYDGAKSLSTKGFQGKTQLAERRALLKESEALVASLQRDIANTVITAPFDGVMLDRHVEIGDYVSVGDPVAEVVDLDPLVVRGDVNQADVPSLSVGQPASITLANGERHTGHIRYLASLSDEKTNTFRVEVSLPNPDHSVLKRFGQEVNLFKLGRMPAQVIVDKDGVARFVHYGKAMSDIPENEELLGLLDEL